MKLIGNKHRVEIKALQRLQENGRTIHTMPGDANETRQTVTLRLADGVQRAAWPVT